jgi:hypothetical protein
LAIVYQPKKILARMASKKNLENLVTENLTVNRAVLNSIATSGVVGKKQLEKIALNVLKDYRDRAADIQLEGATKTEAREEVLENKGLLVNRVQNAMVSGITTQVQDQYRGEFYVWLPSTAVHKDPLHVKKYGKRFQIGKGEMPGDRYGCMCGMKILVPETKLILE